MAMQAVRLRERRTRIIATLGPATNTAEAIAALVQAGADIFRLNFSHGEHAEHKATYDLVREVAAGHERRIAVLADLCGPKIRTGVFAGGGIDLVEGDTVTVTTRDVEGTPGLIPTIYRDLPGDVRPGARILLADGAYELSVTAVEGTEVTCRVVTGGRLGNRKGINLPDVEVSAPALTDKDRKDAVFAAELGVDLMALSFVNDASDIHQLRGVLPIGGGPRIIAKIERPSAVTRIDGILEAADGIMVARGDLGVEMPAEEVPVIQRALVALARRYGKPAIVATQMLESMTEHPSPTRAEVSDVSTAVFSGADAVMLSAETAAGSHPTKAVEFMDRIARRIEAHQWESGTFRVDEPLPEGQVPLIQAVARSVAQLSRDLLVRAIVVITNSGGSAATVSAARPAAPLIAVTTSEQLARQMVLLWGVVPTTATPEELADPVAVAHRVATERGLAERGQHILLISDVGDARKPGNPTIRALTA